MASTTTYGDFPGVKVTTAGGAITGVAIGREMKLVLAGVGDPANGSASVNTATQIDSRLDADRKFGDGSELAEAMTDALANGANIDYLYGVMLDEQSVTNETFTGSSSGTLSNNPIIEDTSVIDVQDTVDAASVTVQFRYDSPPSAPSNSNTVNINPITGEWVADSSSDYEFDYDYPDWSAGLDEAETPIDEEETGIICALSEAEDISSDISSRVNTLRENYKLANGLQAAEPNSNSSDNEPIYDTSAYSDNIDNDAMYLHAPARKDGSKYTISGALGGVMAGNSLDDSIYRDPLSVDDLYERLSETEATDLRDNEVIPIKQPPSGGTVTIAGNPSTSTDTDWERDYWRRRIVDEVILIAKTIGDSVLGNINDDRTRETVETQISVELRGLVGERLIQGNSSIDTNWFVDVYKIDTDTVGIDLGVTPYGIAKRVDVSIQIDA